MSMTTQRTTEGHCMLVRDVCSAPGCGVFGVRYDPRVTQIEHEYFVVPGFEPVENGEQTVGYMQEWAIWPI